jgi:hypothetical protein
MLCEFPIEWMRPDCASFQLLQLALNHPAIHTHHASSPADPSQLGWLARHLPSAIDQHFEFICEQDQHALLSSSVDEKQRLVDTPIRLS